MKYLVSEDVFWNVIRAAEVFDSALGELSQIPPDDMHTGYYQHLQRVRREVVMFKSFLEDHVEVCPTPADRVQSVAARWVPNFLWLEVLGPSSLAPPQLATLLDQSSLQSVA